MSLQLRLKGLFLVWQVYMYQSCDFALVPGTASETLAIINMGLIALLVY